MASKEIEDFQRQALEMFRAQQEAYLNAVKAWRDAMSGAAAVGAGGSALGAEGVSVEDGSAAGGSEVAIG